jgi:hypothetical protein
MYSTMPQKVVPSIAQKSSSHPNSLALLDRMSAIAKHVGLCRHTYNSAFHFSFSAVWTESLHVSEMVDGGKHAIIESHDFSTAV